jgi:hypothetical protein
MMQPTKYNGKGTQMNSEDEQEGRLQLQNLTLRVVHK